jgi:sulfur-oxidizing protein SoxY
MKRNSYSTTRRRVLVGAGALAGGLALGADASLAQIESNPAELEAAIRAAIGDARIEDGKVKLEVPPLVENGNAVPMKVTVDSPMTEKDHVKAIHVFAGKNRQPNVISVKLGPRAGNPEVQTRIRLADTQDILALAELSDGTVWRATANVIITLSACLEDVG